MNVTRAYFGNYERFNILLRNVFERKVLFNYLEVRFIIPVENKDKEI